MVNTGAQSAPGIKLLLEKRQILIVKWSE